MMELTFLKELLLIRQVDQNSAILITIGIFQTKVLNLNQMSTMFVMIY